MLSFISIILIFLENSIKVNFPYNIIALPYITYLVYKKGKKGIFEIILICLLISKTKNNLVELLIIFIIIFIINYYLAKILEYENINIIYYSAIQFIIYGMYLFMKLPYFYIYQGLIMFVGYLLVNYGFIKLTREKR